MSWIEQMAKPYIIKTGDGVEYTVKYKPTQVQQAFNIALFEFPNVAGTVAQRRNVKGERYALDIYFDGDNHLTEMQSFKQSARNPKYWTIQHPMYGTLFVQPLELTYDSKDYNLTRVTGVMIETVVGTKPAKKNAQSKIVADKVQIDQLQATTYATDVQPTVADINSYKGDLTTLYNEGTKGVGTTLDSEIYFNAFTAAQGGIDNLIRQPLAAVRLAQRMIEAPFNFAQNVKARVLLLLTQIDKLNSSFNTILNRRQKRQYETNVGAIITTIAKTTVINTDGSYRNRPDAVAIADQLAGAYNDYITRLDSLQTNTGGDADGYIPDYDSISGITELTVFAINNLYNIAADGRLQVTFNLEEDSDPINITHRLYGLDPDDVFLNEFIDTNMIGLSEMFIIPKGTPITYYENAD
jgi:hypothetical protein